MTRFERLDDQSAPLTRHLTRIVGDRDLAEDLRQDTYVGAWRSAPRDGAPERLAVWLHRTATHLAIDELRRRRRRPVAPLEAAAGAAAFSTAAARAPRRGRPPDRPCPHGPRRPRALHGMAVRRLGRGLRVTAFAPDGLPEAVQVPGRRLALGTQWHPERGGGEALARVLVDAACGGAPCAA